MSVADKGSYFSRFFVKVVEIVAAAVATAVSGYLVAHLSGYFPVAAQYFFPLANAGVPARRRSDRSKREQRVQGRARLLARPTGSAHPCCRDIRRRQ